MTNQPRKETHISYCYVFRERFARKVHYRALFSGFASFRPDLPDFTSKPHVSAKMARFSFTFTQKGHVLRRIRAISPHVVLQIGPKSRSASLRFGDRLFEYLTPPIAHLGHDRVVNLPLILS